MRTARNLRVIAPVLVLAFSIPACAQNEADAGRKPREAEPKDDVPALLKTLMDEFVAITPGKGRFPKSFEMGSAEGAAAERPVHTVTFEYSFAIGKHEVPQNLYRAVMGENPSVWQGPGRDRNACEMMTWSDAAQFCTRATELLRAEKLLKDDEVIRLPSEAEWEYCCRAGTRGAYSLENALAESGGGLVLDAYAWHTGNAAGNDPSVGVLKPNPWGLYDVHGYLWEFVQDAWHDNYTGAPTNGAAWTADGAEGQRVMRGGSWRDDPRDLRCAARRPIAEDERSDAIGFRCVKARMSATK